MPTNNFLRIGYTSVGGSKFKEFKEMIKHRKSQPVLIGEIVKDYLKEVNRKRQMQKILEIVGEKRNELNRSNLRLHGRRRRASLSKLPF